MERYERFYTVIRRIPKGSVATYGQIARLAGLPGRARLVGYALGLLPDSSDVPWYRVVNAAGAISCRRNPFDEEQRQRRRLEREKIRFHANGKIPLSRYQWEKGARD